MNDLPKNIEEHLQLLDAYQPSVPPDLAEKVLARVRSARPVAVVDASAVGAADPTPAVSGYSLFSFRDLIAVAASVAIIVGIFIPVYFSAAALARRQRCEQHLGQIAAGTAQYAADHLGFLPFAGFHQGASWLPDGISSAPRDSNTKNWFLLVKHGYVGSVVFVCPASQGRPFDESNLPNLNDFPSLHNVQYSFQNMAGPREPIDRIGPMPIVADLNPYFQGGQFHPDLPWPRNASVHGDNAGQVVANCDGSARWYTTPQCGIDGDNIYQAGNTTIYFGTEHPVRPADTFVIP